jgi:predicted XRE-type DNA-binding protein
VSALSRPEVEQTVPMKPGFSGGEPMSEELDYTIGSGNVFADLGLPDAEELKAKSDMVIEIIQVIEDRGLKQAEAAEIMGIDQPKVSSLVNGKLSGFSMERLYRLLNALGRDVEIVLRPMPKSRKQGKLTVSRKRARQAVKA